MVWLNTAVSEHIFFVLLNMEASIVTQASVYDSKLKEFLDVVPSIESP